MDSLYPKRSSSISSRLEGVLRHVGANPCCLLDRVGIDLLLFLVSQWWQSAWLDAVSWNLEVRRPDFFLDSCRQRCTEFLRKGQAEIPHSCLGSRLYVGCLSDLYVGDGLETPQSQTQIDGDNPCYRQLSYDCTELFLSAWIASELTVIRPR